jgi:hypothetical protein
MDPNRMARSFLTVSLAATACLKENQVSCCDAVQTVSGPFSKGPKSLPTLVFPAALGISACAFQEDAHPPWPTSSMPLPPHHSDYIEV